MIETEIERHMILFSRILSVCSQALLVSVTIHNLASAWPARRRPDDAHTLTGSEKLAERPTGWRYQNVMLARERALAHISPWVAFP